MSAVNVPAYTCRVGSFDSLNVPEITERGFPLVEAMRGDTVESVHYVAACIATADGDILYELADADRAYPVRSLAKPFLAAELIRSGAADAFHLTPPEIALAAGSHDGEQIHVYGVSQFLMKVGLTSDALMCGPAREGHVEVGPPVANNCSGKHAAVLALCKHLGAPVDGYLDPGHPVQRWLQPRLIDAFGLESVPSPFMIDGCGMPIFSATLKQIAKAFARFGSLKDSAFFRIRASMASCPAYVGGTNGNLDSELILRTDGAIIGKIGAEGLHADAVIPNGIGIAIKVIDGNSRALAPTLISLLQRFAVLPPSLERRVQSLAVRQLRNGAGTPVGVIRARPLP